MPKRNALISVYDKTGIEEFATALTKLGWTIYASGGTAKALTTAGLKVHDVASLVGGGPILDHRVVTLSREIHAGLLARPIKEDTDELDKLGIPYIDLVCNDLYPLTDEIAKPTATLKSVIEKTDIGGPTMIRSAAKGGRIVIAKADQRQEVLDWLKAGEPDADAFRQNLAAEAEGVIANYVLASARYLSDSRIDGMVGESVLAAKYGENPWQAPADLLTTSTNDPLALDRFKVVAGTAPSYNNLAEIDRQLQTITHIAAAFDLNFQKVPYIAVATKHGNPCGAAAGTDPVQVIRQTVMGDPRAIFGGLVMTNFTLTAELAEELLTHGVESGRRLLDAISAPSFDPAAVERLSRKGDKCRFLANSALADLGVASLDTAPVFREVRGGFLRQPNHTLVLNLNDPDLTKTGNLTTAQQRDILLAWAVGSTSNSNTVTLTKNGQLIGNGVGQQDRVGCCELAVKRATDAGHTTKGAAAYSDSFFPFSDAPAALADAGVTAIFATSGSVRDPEIQDFCAKRGVTLWQLPDKKARGFFRH